MRYVYECALLKIYFLIHLFDHFYLFRPCAALGNMGLTIICAGKDIFSHCQTSDQLFIPRRPLTELQIKILPHYDPFTACFLKYKETQVSILYCDKSRIWMNFKVFS